MVTWLLTEFWYTYFMYILYIFCSCCFTTLFMRGNINGRLTMCKCLLKFSAYVCAYVQHEYHNWLCSPGHPQQHNCTFNWLFHYASHDTHAIKHSSISNQSGQCWCATFYTACPRGEPTACPGGAPTACPRGEPTACPRGEPLCPYWLCSPGHPHLQQHNSTFKWLIVLTSPKTLARSIIINQTLWQHYGD